MRLSTRQGFSIIELIVSVLIVSILAAVAVTNFTSAKVRTTIAQTQLNQKLLSQTIFHYQIDQGDLIPYSPIRGRSYLFLTSPIIYLDDLELALDPFAREFINDDGNIIQNPFGYYPYIPFRGLFLSTLPENERNRRKSVKISVEINGTLFNDPQFALQSIGPSKQTRQVIDGTPGNFSLPSLYSPSNGLYSAGSLISIDGRAFN